MGQMHVEIAGVIEAPPEAVYAVLADYLEGHPAILPKDYFTELEVEEGGRGAGTVVGVRMEVMGAKREYRLAVSEPQPGRVLVESDPVAGVTTTFTVEPLEGGRHSRVTIATDSMVSQGLQGWIERLVNPAVTRRIYQAELRQLADYLRE
jgi:hypothetical protein